MTTGASQGCQITGTAINQLDFQIQIMRTDHIVQSGTLELNSNFNSRVSNQLLLAYTHIDDVRNSPGGIFPTIEIFNG